LVDKFSCVALYTTALGPGGAGVECLTGVAGMNVNFGNLAAVIGDEDGELEPEDIPSIDLDGNQLHESDGFAFLFVFVDDQAPIRVTIPADAGRLIRADGSVNPGRVLICESAAEDPDCEAGAAGEDGLVIFGLCSGDGSFNCGTLPPVADTGTYTLTVDQERVPVDLTYRIVGEPDKVELGVFESTIGAGVSDLNNDDDLGDAGECQFAASVEGFQRALVQGEKTIVIARVKDNDGNDVTGGWINWSTSDEDKAVFATALTPTLDLGSFGFGAPNILCGTSNAGTVDAIAELFEGPVGGLDPYADFQTVETEVTVLGIPAAVALTATPAAIPCDGVTSAQVAATVTDADGNPVAGGTKVKFDVQILGVAAPIIATTNNEGVATSTITPVGEAETGVTVNVLAGPTREGSNVDPTATGAILVVCGQAAPGGAPPPPGTGSGNRPPTGVISGPDTGSGGYRDDRALPAWPAVPVLVVAMGLIVARYALRHRSA
jgi:hypothetical protein